jgi:hypothetical protein
MLKWICASILSMTLFGCATGKCVNAATGTTTTSQAGGTAVKPESKLDRVKVFKMDGSLQCGQGQAIPVADMQKDLKDIKVYSSLNKNDGMMRIQVCGAATGNCNVYEIDRKNLEAAIKLGFKEWTFDN